MTPRLSRITLLFSAALLLILSPGVHAQSLATAERSMTLSAWAGGGIAWTGLGGTQNVGGSKNADLTVGADLGLRRFFGIRPEIEVRGTAPVDPGKLVGESSFLGGLKLGADIFGVHIYGDALAGGGSFNFQNGGIRGCDPKNGCLIYTRLSTFVSSFGYGADFNLTPRYAIRADYQFQKWTFPDTINDNHVTYPQMANTTVYPQIVSLGLVYRFNPDRFPEMRHRKH